MRAGIRAAPRNGSPPCADSSWSELAGLVATHQSLSPIKHCLLATVGGGSRLLPISAAEAALISKSALHSRRGPTREEAFLIGSGPPDCPSTSGKPALAQRALLRSLYVLGTTADHRRPQFRLIKVSRESIRLGEGLAPCNPKPKYRYRPVAPPMVGCPKVTSWDCAPGGLPPSLPSSPAARGLRPGHRPGLLL